MFRIHTAALTAVLALAVTSLGAAQTASDTSRTPKQDIRHDEHVIAVDSTKLHAEMAVRDSARSTLAQDQAQTRALGARVDSLKAQLDRERKATPRDSTAIARDEKALAAARKDRDRDLDRDKHEASRLASIEKKIDKETDSRAGANHDIKQERAKEHSSMKARPDSAHRR
jgi:hypothetical protein